MSTKMRMYGGVVGFNDFSSTAVKQALGSVLSSLDPSVEYGWPRAFGEFALFLNPITRGTYLVGAIGEGYVSPTPLFEAALPYLASGSWLVFQEESNPRATILMVDDGKLVVDWATEKDLIGAAGFSNISKLDRVQWTYDNIIVLEVELLPPY